MAENEDRSREDLTDDISQFRLEEMRSKGQVAQSREVTALLALIAAGVTTYTLSPRMGAEMADFMRETFRTDLSARLDLGGNHTLRSVLEKALRITALIALPISVAGFVFGVIGSFGQIGSIFSTDPITPDLNKINPMSGIQRLLSKKTAIDGLRIVFKMAVLVAVAYGLVKSEVIQSPATLGAEPVTMFAAYARAAKAIFLSLVGVLALFAALDWFLTRREYETQLKMTKQIGRASCRERV